MKSNEVRSKFLEFYRSKGHAILPSAPLVPENDPTTLFTGSGMQPLVPYLLGEKHPQGTRLADSQKSFRSGDIEEVGDNRHTTFFEMLGNWSLGDYFKKEQLPWLFSFLTDEVGLDPKRLYVTVFAGDEKNNIPRDSEAVGIWKNLFEEKGIAANDVELISEENGSRVGMQGGRIFYYDAKKNWWSRSGTPDKMPPGEPGGPDSEIFFEFPQIAHDQKYGKECHPNCDCGRFMEIGNSVFMEYRRTATGFEKLPQRNVDFGGGLERIVAASQDKADVLETDLFAPIIWKLEELSGKKYSDQAHTRSFRIVADHIRAAVFLIGDGVVPSNTDQGYFVRRLVRRAVRYATDLGVMDISVAVDPIITHYKEAYPNLLEKAAFIKDELVKEELKFRKTLGNGVKELEKIIQKNGFITGKQMFDLYQSYGFPRELTLEMVSQIAQEIIASQKPTSVNLVEIMQAGQIIQNPEEFDVEHKRHQDLSRAGAEKKFKGGLSGHGEQETRYHTATHLLNAALRKVLGAHVEQRGSNITPERMRFDFVHSAKMTDEEKKKVEDLVNGAIAAKLPVSYREMPIEEAKKLGALGVFADKYGDIVKVYTVGDEKAPAGEASVSGAFSRELCGGPHVSNTGELGHFSIQKEEAVSAGVRRIKAILS